MQEIVVIDSALFSGTTFLAEATTFKQAGHTINTQMDPGLSVTIDQPTRNPDPKALFLPPPDINKKSIVAFRPSQDLLHIRSTNCSADLRLRSSHPVISSCHR